MTIVKLEPSKRVDERWLCWLEDGSIIRVTENEVVAFALYAGMEVSDELYDRLTEAAGRSTVRAKAVDYISHRPMSRKDNALLRGGYIHDGAYAKTVARHYSAKGYGDRKVKDEMFRRGIPRRFWEAALAEAQPAESGVDAFLQKRFKGQAPDRKELKRAADALARRGYNWSEIREGLNRYGAEIEEEL